MSRNKVSENVARQLMEIVFDPPIIQKNAVTNITVRLTAIKERLKMTRFSFEGLSLGVSRLRYWCPDAEHQDQTIPKGETRKESLEISGWGDGISDGRYLINANVQWTGMDGLYYEADIPIPIETEGYALGLYTIGESSRGTSLAELSGTVLRFVSEITTERPPDQSERGYTHTASTKHALQVARRNLAMSELMEKVSTDECVDLIVECVLLIVWVATQYKEALPTFIKKIDFSNKTQVRSMVSLMNTVTNGHAMIGKALEQLTHSEVDQIELGSILADALLIVTRLHPKILTCLPQWMVKTVYKKGYVWPFGDSFHDSYSHQNETVKSWVRTKEPVVIDYLKKWDDQKLLQGLFTPFIEQQIGMNLLATSTTDD